MFEVEAAYPALVRAATVLCWSRSDVEDAVQETVLRAFKSSLTQIDGWLVPSKIEHRRARKTWCDGPRSQTPDPHLWFYKTT